MSITNSISGYESKVVQTTQNFLRNAGPGLIDAKNRIVSLTTNPGVDRTYEEDGTSVIGFNGIVEYVKRKSGAMHLKLCYNRFNVGYEVVGEYDGINYLGGPSKHLNVTVEWDSKKMYIEVKDGVTTSLLFNNEHNLSKKADHSESKKLATLLRVAPNELANNTATISKVLCSYSVAYQQKLMRLVKGICVYLDLLHIEEEQVVFQVATVKYSPALFNTLYNGDGDTSYIHEGGVGSKETQLVLLTMCCAYPNNLIQAHGSVVMPADADNISIINDSDTEVRMKTCYMSAIKYWSVLLEYVLKFNLSKEFDNALCIAAFIRENRYYSSAMLPRTVCIADILYPMCVTNTNDNIVRVPPTRQNTRVVGRALQLMSSLQLQDVVTSAKQTSRLNSNKFEYVHRALQDQSMNYITRDEFFQSGTLSCIVGIDWSKNLTVDEYVEIEGRSFFESFWLVDSGRCAAKEGIVWKMIKGIKNEYEGPIRGAANYTCSSVLMNKDLDKKLIERIDVNRGVFSVIGSGILNSKHSFHGYDEQKFDMQTVRKSSTLPRPKVRDCQIKQDFDDNDMASQVDEDEMSHIKSYQLSLLEAKAIEDEKKAIEEAENKRQESIAAMIKNNKAKKAAAAKEEELQALLIAGEEYQRELDSIKQNEITAKDLVDGAKSKIVAEDKDLADRLEKLMFKGIDLGYIPQTQEGGGLKIYVDDFSGPKKVNEEENFNIPILSDALYTKYVMCDETIKVMLDSLPVKVIKAVAQLNIETDGESQFTRKLLDYAKQLHDARFRATSNLYTVHGSDSESGASSDEDTDLATKLKKAELGLEFFKHQRIIEDADLALKITKEDLVYFGPHENPEVELKLDLNSEKTETASKEDSEVETEIVDDIIIESSAKESAAVRPEIEKVVEAPVAVTIEPELPVIHKVAEDNNIIPQVAMDSEATRLLWATEICNKASAAMDADKTPSDIVLRIRKTALPSFIKFVLQNEDNIRATDRTDRKSVV